MTHLVRKPYLKMAVIHGKCKSIVGYDCEENESMRVQRKEKLYNVFEDAKHMEQTTLKREGAKRQGMVKQEAK